MGVLDQATFSLALLPPLWNTALATKRCAMAMAQAFKRFVPTADRILVQKVKADVKSAGGIILPDAAKQEVNQATVLAVGSGKRNQNGELIPMNTKVGDVVVVPRYGGTELKFGDDECHVYQDEDIVGIINPE